jgi:hypothetical protein
LPVPPPQKLRSGDDGVGRAANPLPVTVTVGADALPLNPTPVICGPAGTVVEGVEIDVEVVGGRVTVVAGSDARVDGVGGDVTGVVPGVVTDGPKVTGGTVASVVGAWPVFGRGFAIVDDPGVPPVPRSTTVGASRPFGSLPVGPTATRVEEP